MGIPDTKISKIQELRLRAWQKKDAPVLAELANNRKIWDQVRDYFPSPYTHRHAEEWIATQIKRRPLTQFAIDCSGELCGAAGFLLKEDIYRCSAELGYWIGEPYWNRGIATEAVRLLMEHLREQYPSIIRVYAEVFHWNQASARVLQKNGFFLEATRKQAIIKNERIGDDQLWVWLRADQE